MVIQRVGKGAAGAKGYEDTPLVPGSERQLVLPEHWVRSIEMGVAMEDRQDCLKEAYRFY